MEINQAYENFVYLMWVNIQQAVQKAVDIKYQKISKQKLTEIIRASIPGVSVTCNDEQYQLTDIATWKKIIRFDWTARKKYLTDVFDCDNFSDAFRAHACELYNLNSAGRFSCHVKSDDGKVNTAHRAVIIVALDENDEPAIYAYESENEGLAKITKGQTIRISIFGTVWNYSPVLMEFN